MFGKKIIRAESFSRPTLQQCQAVKSQAGGQMSAQGERVSAWEGGKYDFPQRSQGDTSILLIGL